MTRDSLHDLVGAYVLDALEPDDRVAFEARLADDDQLRRLVDETREATLVLAESLPAAEPSADLRGRILEQARERPPASGDVDSRPAPEASGSGRASTESVRPDDEGGRPTGPKPARSVAPWLLLAASLAGLLWLGRQNVDLRNQSAALASQLEAVRGSLIQTEAALAGFDSLALALTGPNVQLATLTGDTEPSLRLVWNRDRDLLLVAAQGLPAAAPGRTYQLWGIRGTDAPVSLGTFDTDAAGAALVTLTAGAAVDFDVSAITDEPAGGSPQPTTQPFLVGAWTTSQ